MQSQTVRTSPIAKNCDIDFAFPFTSGKINFVLIIMAYIPASSSAKKKASTAYSSPKPEMFISPETILHFPSLVKVFKSNEDCKALQN